MTTATTEAAFWERVDTSAEAGCWNWLGFKDRLGYGHVRASQLCDSILTHRVAWTCLYGRIPAGLDVLHECDNPSCCNPSHLRLGTHQDNMRDKAARGRVVVKSGQQSNLSSLTEEAVTYIWENRHRHQSKELATKFGVTKSAITRIYSGRTWAVYYEKYNSLYPPKRPKMCTKQKATC